MATVREILENIQFQVTGDDAVVASLDQLGDAFARASAEGTAQLGQLESAFGNLSGATADQIEQNDALADSFRADQLQAEIDGMVQLAQSEQDAADKAAALKAQWDEIFAQQQQVAAGYGNEGGQIGPAEDDGSGGGINIGNPLAIGRGARAAGGLARLAGAPQLAGPLTGGADILFVQRGLQELQDTFSQLNDVVKDTPGLLAPLVEGFTALGVPMAGLAAVALPVVAALVALAAEVSAFLDTINKGTQGIKDDVQQLEDQSKLAGTGDTQGLTTARDKALAESGSGGDQDALTQLQKQQSAYAKQLSDAAGSGDMFKEAELIPIVKTLNDEVAAAQKKLDDANVSVNNYNQALGDTQVQANDASEAVRANADALEASAQRYAQYDQLNSAQITQQVAKLQDEIDVRNKANAMLQANNDAQGTSAYQIDLNNQAISKNNDQIIQDTGDINHLTDASRGLADARDAEAASAKAVDEAVKALTKEDDILAQQTQATADEAKQEADAKTKADQSYQDTLDQFIANEQKLVTDGKRKEEDIVQASADKIADIRTKASNQDADAWNTYLNQLADDQTKYQEDSAKLIQDNHNTQADDLLKEQQKMSDLVVKEHDSEVADALTHQQALATIRQNAMQSEQDDVLQGNFEKLYQDQQAEKNKEATEDTSYDNKLAQLHLQLQQQEQDEVYSYSNQEQLLQQHLAQQQDALNTSIKNQEVAQITAEQRKVEADQLNANRAIEQENTNEERKTRDLNTWAQRQQEDLDTAEVAKLNQIGVNLTRELALYQENYNAREQLLQQELADTQALIAGTSGGASGGSLSGHSSFSEFAAGGEFGAGQGFVMSEAGSDETLNIAGRSYRVGGGAAYVTPLQGGNVQSKSNSDNVGPVSIYIQGVQDPQANADAVAEMLQNWTKGQ